MEPASRLKPERLRRNATELEAADVAHQLEKPLGPVERLRGGIGLAEPDTHVGDGEQHQPSLGPRATTFEFSIEPLGISNSTVRVYFTLSTDAGVAYTDCLTSQLD